MNVFLVAVRSREHILGLPDISPEHRREVLRANALVSRLCTLLGEGTAVGTQFVVENPIDRGDRSFPRAYLNADHGPLWLMPDMLKLEKRCQASRVNFPMCEFGARWQKATTLLYTPAFEPWLGTLRELACTHTHHDATAGGSRDANGRWISQEAAAYPPAFNLFLARALSSLHSPSLAPPLSNTPPSLPCAPCPLAPRFDGLREVELRLRVRVGD